MKRYILLIVMFFTLAGCSAARNDVVKTERLSATKIDVIRSGHTGKDKILEMFGTPDNRLLVGEEETFFYKDENLNALWISFGKDDRVKKVVSTKRNKGSALKQIIGR